ncbi:NAD(P)/FAD-dependent oxidoreductase [Phenylobacterium sp.]|jgi:2-polyprenyl-6-methoxyphenol hydroxylase-like FAD-dependent oxidoreductase|uniref:NAD(P)/FAD-dependent oxidoreductase n=1 Tax=Phenylobacterium sp. TaxID=1871053 RepID=UPI002F92DEE4
MSEKILVIGAGMAGLWTALALAPTGRQVILLERDPPPPEGGPEAAFTDWSRRGVGQLRHSHAFLARLRNLIRDEHPALLADLLAAGCRELTFQDNLTAAQRQSYQPKPVDQDLVILTSRRTTLEFVIRRYVEALPNVTLRPETFVQGLLVEPGDPPRVTGVRLQDGGELTGDVVVDAGGRTSGATDDLAAIGVALPQEVEPSGVVYFTRHYRLRPGAEEPPRGKTPATGDLDYLKFGVFPGDNGCFSITLCCPEVEEELRKAIVDPQVFDAVCNALPGLVPWVDPQRSEATSRVFGMGDLLSRWIDLAPEGRPLVLGYVAVGDSLVRTNPLYGRGCSFAAVSAVALRDALRATPDPAGRLLGYQARIRQELRPYYDVMRDTDRQGIRRARRAMQPAYQPSLRARLTRSFVEDGVTVALRSDPDLMRAFLRGFHMLEHPQAWLKRPENLARVLGYWARGRRRNAEAYRPPAGPGRREMLERLGLSPDADPRRLAAA